MVSFLAESCQRQRNQHFIQSIKEKLKFFFIDFMKLIDFFWRITLIEWIWFLFLYLLWVMGGARPALLRNKERTKQKTKFKFNLKKE